MLERGRLLVRDGDASGSRAVEDAATGAPLGTARPVAPGGGWLPGRPLVEVREAGDAPLLFTVRGSWPCGTRHGVRDADGRPVGWVAGAVIADAAGRPLAVRGTDGAFRDGAGAVLARVERANGGVEIAFEGAALNPFGKMLLLAAVLWD
jgi:hypothetical protein